MKRTRLLPFISLLLLLCILFLGISGVVGAYYTYVDFNTGADSSNDTFSANWTSQSFLTTINHTISVSSAELLLYKVGNPGTITASIRAADSNGKPTGSDLTSGTYDGNSLTTDNSTTTFTEVDFTVYLLSANTTYTLVLRAPSGNITNTVNWRVDASTPTYSDGLLSYSTDSGSSWAVDSTQDALFNIIGEPVTMTIESVKIFQNTFAENDQLFFVEYKITYTVDPTELPQHLYSLYLDAMGRELTEIGHYATSMYVTAADAWEWGSARTILIEGSPLFEAPTPNVTYNTVSSDYVPSETLGRGRGTLFAHIMTLAAIFETSWGATLTFDHDSYGHILNLEGARIFEEMIPGVAGIIPIIGAMLYWASPEDIGTIDISDFEYGNWTYQTTLDAESANQTAMWTDMGNWLGVSGTWVKGSFVVMIYFLAVGGMYAATKSPVGALVLAFPTFPMMSLVIAFPLIWVAIPAFLILVGAAYFIWLRGT